MMSKKVAAPVKQKLLETQAGTTEINGFGDNVVKITDTMTGRVVCFIGKQGGGEEEELLHFPCPVPVALVDAIGGILEKRKMRKALEQGDYEKAQRFADRKVADFYSKK
jgi:hypothetical protein